MIAVGLKDKISATPLSPGVYLIRDRSGRVVYVGKARLLRLRLYSHFRESARADEKEILIQRDAADVEVVQTGSEAEALLLEASLVKEFRPRYNKELKDDKSYPFLKITMEEKFPRLLVTRGRESDGSLYFGPYTNAKLLRQAVAFIRRLFPMRTCDPIPQKTCLMVHIGQCRAPCVGAIGRGEYARTVRGLVLFLEGKKQALVRRLERRMNEASAARRYEDARFCRDQIQALSTISVLRSPLDRVMVLDRMRETLGLSRYPRRIEAFDVSNFSGKNPVGSLVVFADGAPRPSEYRLFKIESVAGIDDYAMMRETVRRRYERVLAEKTGLPDLVLIDGGRGHLAAAKTELERLNLTDLDLISIAKKHEVLFKPSREAPITLPQDSAILQLLRHVRDEAHRFAIGFYRRLHKKEFRWSELDEIPGVGGRRKAALVKAFGSVSRIRDLSAGELAAARGVDRRTARNVEEYFKKR